MKPSSPLGTRHGQNCLVRPVFRLTPWNSYERLTRLRRDAQTSFSTFLAIAVAKSRATSRFSSAL